MWQLKHLQVRFRHEVICNGLQGGQSQFGIVIRRYGFPGINHRYCAEGAAQLLGKDPMSLKLVTCLGNGCSAAAIHETRSLDSTVGFTPLDGLMMGTRSGSVDPGILTSLMRQGQLDGQEIGKVLNQKSGLLGISGLSSDIRDILVGIQ